VVGLVKKNKAMKTYLVSIWAALAASSLLLFFGCATYRGAPPLQAAVDKGEVAAVRQLLQAGTPPNERGPGGWTALHRAAYRGKREITQVLLDAGARMNVKDNQGFTPLHWAVCESVLIPEAQDVAKLLVARGADINARDKEGSTPLFWAVWQGNRELADFLLAHGADPGIKGKENLTPLELARRYPGAH
jgi:ankyrin repeat protein